jgi:hypothetical protein
MLHQPAKLLESRLARYTQMTPEEWAKVPDCPRQRNTELHAKKAIGWLNVQVPPHLEVKMAKLPDSRTFKLDGHTRSWLWERRAIPVPDHIEVTVYELQDLDEVLEAYTWFDNINAAERGTDVVQGALRANGLHPVSYQLRTGRLNTALRRIYRAVASDEENYQSGWNYDTVYEAVRLFSRELMFLDSLEPSSKLFPPGIQMAVLITVKRDASEAMTFWKLYAEERGRKDGDRMDAVQALMEGVILSKSRNNRNNDIVSEMFSKGLAAFQSYRNGNDYAAGMGGVRPLSPISVGKYVKRRGP